jgi:hypothetical protein
MRDDEDGGGRLTDHPGQELTHPAAPPARAGDPEYDEIETGRPLHDLGDGVLGAADLQLTLPSRLVVQVSLEGGAGARPGLDGSVRAQDVEEG